MSEPEPATRGSAPTPSVVAPFGSRLLGPADEPARALRVRLQVLTTAALVVAHVVGAGVVTALNAWVLPRPEAVSASAFRVYAIAVPVYLVLAVAVGVVWGTRRTLRRMRWIIEDREPDWAEQRAALNAPVALVWVQAVLWLAATVLFTVLTAIVQPGNALNVALSIALGGSVTCMAAYLLSEFSMRPVAARALTHEPPERLAVPGVTVRSLLAWGLGSGIPVVGLMVIAVLSLVRGDVSADRLAVTIIVLGAISIVVGLLLVWLAMRAVVDPIRSLTAGVRSVRAGELDTEVVVYEASEIGLLQAAFNRMIAGLRERDRVRDLFGRHVGEAVAQEALAQGIELGGETRRVSVLFVDIIGSTELAAARPPHEVVALLNRFFGVVVGVVDDHGGAVNKFEGDGALAVFGAPVVLADDHGSALAAARVLCRRLRDDVPEVGAGIGVSTGEVVAGNVGEQRRFEYTVIGDPVNEAARLCEQAQAHPHRVLASMVTVDEADPAEARHWIEADPIVLRGRPEVTRTAVPRQR